MVITKETTELEEENKSEARDAVAKARIERDANVLARDTRAKTRRGGELTEENSNLDDQAKESEENLRAAVSAYEARAKTLDQAERRADTRYGIAHAERERGLVEMQARFTTEVIKILLPGKVGLAFRGTADGNYVTPGTAITSLRAYITEMPIFTICAQAATVLKVIDLPSTVAACARIVNTGSPVM